jgi:hypothetical protein
MGSTPPRTAGTILSGLALLTIIGLLFFALKTAKN